jgi:uncharacterized protein (DUF2237 family)
MPSAKNVLGGPLQSCSTKPLTGFYRDGCCNTGPDDEGLHTICCQVTAEFLAHQTFIGNDLTTPFPMYGFPGLQPGDRWCVCITRWSSSIWKTFSGTRLAWKKKRKKPPLPAGNSHATG